MNTDYHIHTRFCNHASGSMKDFIESAINKELNEISFLDHLTLFEKDFKNSMTDKEVGLYLYSIKKLALEYKYKISIKSGLEVDYHPDFFKTSEKIISKYDFDLIGASVHFVEGFNIASRRCQKDYNHIPHNELAKKYFNALYDMLEYDFFDMICHFDLINKFKPDLNFEKDKKIRAKIEKILNRIKDKKKIVEINTSGFLHPLSRQYPDKWIIKECIKLEIPLVFSSDSHSPDELGRSFDKIKNILNQDGDQIF